MPDLLLGHGLGRGNSHGSGRGPRLPIDDLEPVSASAAFHPAVLALGDGEVDDRRLVFGALVTDHPLVVHRGHDLRIVLRAGRWDGFFRLPQIFGVQALARNRARPRGSTRRPRANFSSFLLFTTFSFF